ncbi:MAG: glycosyltransferase [Clostridiales bacterium]|nr:glycosyltransferase [Clostridiales bacterium]
MTQLKILLATTGLDIGGAETHVTELAKELKKMGHTPIVTSSGGIYEEELKDYDIEHIKSPLDSKNIKDILVSFSTLYKAVKENNIDIIHAHGRIAALIAKIVSSCLKVNFMTTSHALFDSRLPFRYLTFWGDEVIAVSEDVKRHLMKCFEVAEEKITVIPNGISEKKFNPDIDYPKALEELGLKQNSKKIVYISRITDALAELTKLVIEAGLLLNENTVNAEIIIVGDGDQFTQIEAVAKEANTKNDVVRILGKRVDIAKILSIADVVIGVGRTSLEAMAMGKPVIIAGGEGYAGLLTPSNYELVKETNFTGRDVGSLSSAQQLCVELLSVFELSKNELRETNEFVRVKIVESYYIDKMAINTESVYYRLQASDD